MSKPEPFVDKDVPVEAARSVLSQMLHDERTKAGTHRVDCWACEASQSEAVQALAARVVLAEAASSHANAVLARAVPDETDRLALWRAHWAEQMKGSVRICGRSDCQRPAETVSVWRSESGRLWERTACRDHYSPEPPLPGFALVNVERVTPPEEGES